MFKQLKTDTREPSRARTRLVLNREPSSQLINGQSDATEQLSARGEAIATLKLGVSSWNAWIAEKRKADPEFRPDLRGIDFRSAEWRSTPLWRKTFERVRDQSKELICLFEDKFTDRGNYSEFSIVPIDMKGAILYDAHCEGVALFEADLRGAHFDSAHFDRAYLSEAHMEGASLNNTSLRSADLAGAHLDKTYGRPDFEEAFVSGTSFNGAYIGAVSFRNAYLGNADFEDADCFYINVEGAVLRGTDFTHARVTEIRYKRYRGWPLDIFPFNQGLWPFKRNLMLGNYLGIRGLDSCYGSPGFRRDALDQDFVDDKFERVKLVANSGQVIIQNRWIGWLVNSEWGLRIRRVLSLPFRTRWTRLPARLAFAMWGFFDYGRSMLSLLVFSSLIIGLIGWWYQGLEIAGAITFTGNLANAGAGDAVAQYARPWFAAFMGFATLGITDLVRPNTWVGQLAMGLDVLTGFSMLGLFIAVFQNKFARRS